MKPAVHIIAIDPSGAFHEGKGTTGMCIWNAIDGFVQEVAYISARQYDMDIDYWQAHLSKLAEWRKTYPKSRVVIEDYFIYGQKAELHTNSRMETCQLIGILKYYCAIHRIPYRMQAAAEVKRRWSDEILMHKGVIQKRGRLLTDKRKHHLNRHILDAIRHAVHAATFYNKEDETQWITQFCNAAM